MEVVVVEALGTIPQELGTLSGEGRYSYRGLVVSVGVLQKVALLGTARILREGFGETVVV